MNIIFLAIVMIAFLVAAIRQIAWEGIDQSPMELLGAGMIKAAEGSVTLAIGLIGVMALFLGLMKVAEAGGLLTIVARLLRPLMVRLFPEVPADHPAMGAMIMNFSANVLGLGNAATPFGIRAMQELDKLNPHKGTATNAMALFLAINTSSITLLPTGVIAIRAAAGSADPAGILPTTLFATICSTTVAIVMAKLLQRYWSSEPAGLPVTVEKPEGEPVSVPLPEAEMAPAGAGYPAWVSMLALGTILAMVPVTIIYGRSIAPWIIPGLMVLLLGFGAIKRVKIYEVFVEGAKDGFQVAVRIIPYLVAILVAVAMFRASGALEMLIVPLGAVTNLVGLPPEALPMALLRPLSGSGAYGIMASIINDPAIGPDSYTGYLVSTLQGSTETTFYVLAVYFGAVNIRRLRHTLFAALSADLAGIIAAVTICLLLFGALR
ncbi:MAG: nucleoside recognition domain-containing protein [Oceanibaculum nanhaiense]|uniref:nucleoside recognition domain-containing protein n=1 Tax=Oceanibaculum nanhaiense TaxID=1909734 RepID=UPI0025A35648|nr:nucleoside recognition domain-containing protein [Oceanibaculum nanhaiense]MDM7946852.1 nucleoside recognition domain-containing protein [Oceanibaculum nanhaiense]